MASFRVVNRLRKAGIWVPATLLILLACYGLRYPTGVWHELTLVVFALFLASNMIPDCFLKVADKALWLSLKPIQQGLQGWVAKQDDRFRAYRVFFFGVLLVLFLPFELVSLVGIDVESVCELVGGGRVGLWELSMVFWSVDFMLMIGVADFIRKHSLSLYKDNISGGLQVYSLFLGIAVASTASLCWAFFVYNSDPGPKLWAELFMVGVFCVHDYFLGRSYTEASGFVKAEDYYKLLYYVDLPACVGFGALTLFYWVHVLVSVDSVSLHELGVFASGGSAFSLVAVNTAFFFIYIQEMSS